MDRAFLRRFAYSLELKEAGPAERKRALRTHLGTDHRMSDDDIDAIAQRFESCPAQLASAATHARFVASDGKPDRATMEKAPRSRSGDVHWSLLHNESVSAFAGNSTQLPINHLSIMHKLRNMTAFDVWSLALRRMVTLIVALRSDPE